MDNPLENFLKDLANKIQTAKEYKDIVQDSQNVDVNKNVFEGFITGVAETIKKELKERATVVPVSASDISDANKQEEDSFVKFVSTLATTISANKNKPAEPVSNVEIIKPNDEDEDEEKESKPVSTNSSDKDSFQKFLGNLKDILKKDPNEKPKTIDKKTKQESKPKQVNQYVDELKKEKNEAEEKPVTKEDSIKKLVRQFVEKEIKNFKDEVGTKIGQMGSSYGGGGNNSYNYYPDGGPMYGNLSFPASGTGVVFADGTKLTSTAGLTASGGGGGSGDPAVNALVHTNSGYWNAAYTNLVTNSAAYLLSGTNVDLGDIPVLSANWNSVYTSVSDNSAYWADTRQDVTFAQNVTIQGNLTALGTSTFKNTIFTTTSALSVINTGPGPALYVFQSSGPYDVASFYDGDGVEVLHVGNANVGQGGKVGINESYPSVELTVNGQISSNNIITVQGGGSNQWNSVYSTVGSYSATWNTGLQDLSFDENNVTLSITNGNTVSLSALSSVSVSLGDVPVLSSNWNSSYSTTSYFSAFWNAVVDEIFTFYVTQTSAASAFWTEDGNYYFIQNSKLDNWQLWNSMYTTLYLNSAGWESTESTVQTNSAKWNSVYSTFNTNSSEYESVYTTYNQNSASYATEILAIAYAVAL